MKNVVLDRLKDSIIYAVWLTVITVFVSAAFWWETIPGKVIVCLAALEIVVLTFVIYMLLYVIEKTIIDAIKDINNCSTRRNTK